MDIANYEKVTTSERAIAAGALRDGAERADHLGIGKLGLHAALMAAVLELPSWITTDKKGAHNIKYATLKQILEKVTPVLHEQGIRIRQGADRSWELNEGGGMKGRLIPVYTDLIHTESGEVERTLVEIPLTKLDPQAMGSAITYGRRYSLLAALGLSTDEADDDGDAALPKGLTERTQMSPDLATLLKEIAAFKSATDLAEWGHDEKQTKRLHRLSEAERAVAKKTYDDRAQALLAAPEEDPAPAKKGKS
ncbi:MAG: ERF family protein [Proteobacteria bacterium]|nr:ERF family protein [Pseudomonadota bacterium]